MPIKMSSRPKGEAEVLHTEVVESPQILQDEVMFRGHHVEAGHTRLYYLTVAELYSHRTCRR